MTRRVRCAFALALVSTIAGAGCTVNLTALSRCLLHADAEGNQTMNQESSPSIGVATMNADGTIVLRLRAETDDGATGEGYFTYAPTDKNYQSILRHVGGLEPGETKPVPPWPDD